MRQLRDNERSRKRQCPVPGVARTGRAIASVDAEPGLVSVARFASGCSSMVEQKPSKLTTRVRFPSPAPRKGCPGTGEHRAPERSDGRQPFALTRVDTAMARRHMARLPDLPGCRPGPRGEVAEWLKAADCKSARASVRWFESSPLHHHPGLHQSPSAQRRPFRCKVWRARREMRRAIKG